MSPEDRSAERQLKRRLIGGLAVAVLFAMACLWLWLPRWDFLVEPVAPDVRDEIAEAVEAATDPSERARLRFELAALEQEDGARRSGLRGTIAQVGTALLAGGAAAWAALAAWGQLQDNRKEAEAAREDTDEQLRLSPGGASTVPGAHGGGTPPLTGAVVL